MMYLRKNFIKFLLILFISINLFSMEKKSDTYFVGNMPEYVPSDNESETTDSELKKNDYRFDEKDFDDPPYATFFEKIKKNNIKKNKSIRGGIVSGCFFKDMQGVIVGTSDLDAFVIRAKDLLKLSTKKYESKVLDPYLKVLEETAFIAEREKDEKLQNIKFVIGLNRPRSLSSKKNLVLYKELASLQKSPIDVRFFGFFWDFPWMKFERDKNGILIKNKKGKKVGYEEVLAFYKKFKKRNPKKAKEFRILNEKSHGIRNRMVPYRSLREVVKNSNQTEDFVKEIRTENTKTNIYLFITDPDTVDFNGCFSNYFEIADNERPDVFTSGYNFYSDKQPMVTLASELDMLVRDITAKNFPQGVYFPEPSLCLRVLPDKNNVAESFEKLTPTGKVSKKDYNMPGESKNIIDKIYENRKNPKVIFSKVRNLFTKAPARSFKNKRSGDLIFKGKYQNGIVTNWEFNDLINITKNSAQSHAYGKSWATNMLEAFEFKDCSYSNVILDERIKRQVSISLLNRLFNSYDPINLAENSKDKLLEIIKNYNEFVSEDKIQKYELNPYKDRAHEIWSYIDNIESRKELLMVLSKIIENLDIEKLDETCKNIGKAIAEFIFRKFYSDEKLENSFNTMNFNKKN